MAEEAVAFVSTGATLPVGRSPVFDNVTIGGSTGIVEYVKLMSGSSGSTTLVPASSASIGAIGLNVSVTNSTANAVGVQVQGGQSSVSISNSPTVLFSTASTASVIIANTTAAAGIVQLAYNSSLVSTSTPLPVLLQNSTATVTIQGNASVTVSGNSTAALSTVGMGGSTGNPMYVYPLPYFTAASTFASTTLTSTTAWTAFSSAASTRFVITDVEVTNQGTTIVLLSIFDGTSGGTVIDRTYCATAGGGKVHAYITPVYNTTGNAITVQQDAASTITVNLRGYRSS